jgi:phosphoribosylformylglycinamidine synthase
MKARVTVTLKNGVLDPQGQAIQGSLKSLGFDDVASVRQGKIFDVELDAWDAAAAEVALKQMSQKLLANTVIENFAIEIVDGATAGPNPAPSAAAAASAKPRAEVPDDMTDLPTGA